MSNKEILAAVIIEWLRPVIPGLLGSRLSSIPFLSVYENWVRNTGIAPANWSVAQDIAPIIQGAAYDMFVPFFESKMAGVADEAIPQMAHGIVDSALANGELNIAGGYIRFEKNDLQELKNYLDYNLPFKARERYNVITKKPEADGDMENNPHD